MSRGAQARFYDENPRAVTGWLPVAVTGYRNSAEGASRMTKPCDMTTGEAEAFRRGWEAARGSLPTAPPAAFREKVWATLERNAEVGNLKPGMISGNGFPDYVWREAIAAIRAMEPHA
jgi:hypothetical protein